MRWLLLLAVISAGFAKVFVYYPVYAELNDWENVFFGKAGPGHVVTIITDRGPKADPWTEVEGNYVISYTPVGNRMEIKVSAPQSEGTNQFCLTLKGKESVSYICPVLIVDKNVVDARADSYSKTCAGIPAEINVLVENNSIGATIFDVQGKRVELEEKSEEVLTIKALPPLPGVYEEKITVIDQKSGWKKTITVPVYAEKCVLSEFIVARHAFPITNILLFPAYILGAILHV